MNMLITSKAIFLQYKYFIFPLMNAYTAESQMYTTRLKNAEMLQEFGGDW